MLASRHIALSILAGLCGAAAVALTPTGAQAIVINDADAGPDANDPNDGDDVAVVGAVFADSVAQVLIPLGGGSANICSGALISSTHLLTAEHCFYDANGMLITSNPQVTFFDIDGVQQSTRTGTDVILMGPDPGPGTQPPLLDGTDLAVIELATPFEARFEPLRLLEDPADVLGDVGVLVGYGLVGQGSTGVNSGVSDRPRGATQALEYYGPAVLSFDANTPNDPADDVLVPFPGTENIYSTDFDDPADPDGPSNVFGQDLFNQPGSGLPPQVTGFEGTTAGGDSGGPLLVNFVAVDTNEPEWLIAAALSGGSVGNSSYGDLSYWTGVGSDEAQAFLEPFGEYVERASIPAPAAGGLLAAAAAVLAFAGRRRRPA
ncbi:MAG: trypsin-like serine protease [Pseudomonadota bacterium]